MHIRSERIRKRMWTVMYLKLMGHYISIANKLAKRNNGTVSRQERYRSGNFVILATQTLACGLGKSRTVSAGNHSANQSNSTFIRLEGDFKTCHFLLRRSRFPRYVLRKTFGQQRQRSSSTSYIALVFIG